MPPQADLLPGTLDVLILNAVSLGAQHGYGVVLRIEQITGGAMAIEQAPSIPRCTGSNTKGCSKPSGASPRTTAARSSTASPHQAGSA
jgi:hypothetical protein